VIKKAWLQHYRPIGWLQHEASVRLDPCYFGGRAPKILAGAYLSLAASLLFFFLRHCGTGVSAAAVVSAGFVLSRLVNEITLWNICAPLDLALAWFILGALLWAKNAGASRLALGAARLLFATLTYQTYLTIVPCCSYTRCRVISSVRRP